MSAGSHKEGTLEVKIGLKWKKRYIVFKDRALYFYKDASDYKKGKSPVDMVELSGGDIQANLSEETVTKSWKLTLAIGSSKHTFSSSSRSELESWMISLGCKVEPEKKKKEPKSDPKSQPKEVKDEPKQERKKEPKVSRTIDLSNKTHLKLTLAGSKLAQMDSGLAGKSDPFIKIWCKSPNHTESHSRYHLNYVPATILLYKSEVIQKSLNPTWKPFEIDISRCGGPDAVITIEIIDEDPDGKNENMGIVTAQLKNLAEANKTFPVTLKGKQKGDIIVKEVEALSRKTDPIVAFSLHTSMKHLPRMDGPLGKCDPFFEIRVKRNKSVGYSRGEAEWILIYRSEIVKKSLEPTFKPCTLDLRDIGYYAQDVKISVFDFDDDGTTDYIGEFETTFPEMHFGGSYYIINHKKEKTPGYKNSGSFIINSCIPNNPLPDDKYISPLYWSLTFNARELPLENPVKSPDPFFVLSTHNRTVFRSNVCKNTKKPQWQPAILSTEDFRDIASGQISIDEDILIDIYDWDADGGHDKLVDRVVTSIRELLLENSRIFLKPKGELNLISMERVDAVPSNISPAYRLTTSGKKIAKMDIGIAKSDPYFEVRTLGGLIIHRSKVQKNTSSPVWDPFVIATKDVGFYQKFKVTVIDWDPNGTHDVIGLCTTSLYELTLGSFQYPLLRIKDKNTSEIIEYGKGKSYGAFSLDSIEPCEVPVIPIPLAVELSCGAAQLPRMDSVLEGGKSDPFFIVHKHSTPGDYKQPKINNILYQSEVVFKELSPVWKPFTIRLADIALYQNSNGWDDKFCYCY